MARALKSQRKVRAWIPLQAIATFPNRSGLLESFRTQMSFPSSGTFAPGLPRTDSANEFRISGLFIRSTGHWTVNP